MDGGHPFFGTALLPPIIGVFFFSSLFFSFLFFISAHLRAGTLGLTIFKVFEIMMVYPEVDEYCLLTLDGAMRIPSNAR